jgi:tetratricopeptide (TPR) repeat protein
VAADSVGALPDSVVLSGFRHTWQTWNNCGPATISMATSYFGRPEGQAQAAAFLKPNPDDKNVTPDELVAYVRSLGLRGENLYAGDMERLKRLLAIDVPSVISMWYVPHPNDGMGHYRLVTGYDDAAGVFLFHDSYVSPGVNVRIPYGAFDEDWRVYSRAYLPVYAPEQAEAVAAIVEGDLSPERLRQRGVAAAEQEAAARPESAYSWFNLGTALTRVGRTGEAALAFDRARAIGLPWRLLWYQHAPFEAYLAEGRFGDLLALAEGNVRLAPELEESQYYMGRALAGLGRAGEARAAYQLALRVNPGYAPALYALGMLSA